MTIEKFLKKYKIFFVSGLPKSGTTWLMNMLNCLKEVLCLGEGGFFFNGGGSIPSLYDSLVNGLRPWYNFIAHRKKNWVGLDEFIQTINRYNFLPSKILNESFNRDLKVIIRLVICYFMEKAVRNDPQIKLIGDKTPVIQPNRLRLMNTIFPEARIIFMRRNVKDFIVSLLFHYWRSIRNNRPDCDKFFLKIDDFLRVEHYINSPKKNSMEFVSEDTAIQLAKQWVLINREAEQIKREKSKVLTIVSYEQLWQSPVETMKEILSFLDLDVSDERLIEIVQSTSISTIKHGQDECLKTHVRSGKPGNWTIFLSNKVSKAIDKYFLD